jgi:outer membrane protein OmpA-like peptidoglycan-associated protein
MNIVTFRRVIVATTTSILMVACSNVQHRYAGADPVRARLTQLEGNNELASQAPMAMEEARSAVLKAEQSQKDPAVSEHLVFIAERKVDIAEAESQQHYLEEQRSKLSAERDAMQLLARTKESEMARSAANQSEKNAVHAQQQALEAQKQAGLAQIDAELAKQKMLKAEQETAEAQVDASLAKQGMNKAEQESAEAKRQLIATQTQLKELDARRDARGTVVTLGDVLFDFNKADINPAAISHLAKLAAFLNSNIDRDVTIEGHTDNVGAKDFNMLLSQRRANAVSDYLQSQGVEGARLQAAGKGAEFPVTDNSTAPKRQQNRRVEVIIADPVS